MLRLMLAMAPLADPMGSGEPGDRASRLLGQTIGDDRQHVRGRGIFLGYGDDPAFHPREARREQRIEQRLLVLEPRVQRRGTGKAERLSAAPTVAQISV
jgi:hypothetical protein